MALSGTYDFAMTRDDIISVALRRINEIGTGETPNATRVTECSLVLNMIMKAWQADGMQLWRKQQIQLTGLTSGTRSFNIGTGQTINTIAPLRVIQAFYRDNTSGADQPLIIQTYAEDKEIGNKTIESTPSMLLYVPPGATTGNPSGALFFNTELSADFVANKTVFVIGIYPANDFDSSTDNPDCPSYFYDALAWALAASLSHESGLPLAERAQIRSIAKEEKENALSLDQEEGSIFFQPTPRY